MPILKPKSPRSRLSSRKVKAVRAPRRRLTRRARPWQKRELAYLVRHYKHKPATKIAAHLKRSVLVVYTKASHLGLSSSRVEVAGKLEGKVFELYELGMTDREIAVELKCNRRTIFRFRRAHKLTPNTFSRRQRDKIRERTAARLRKLGIKNFCDLRWGKYREEARRLGWPDDLKPTALKILNVLYEQGPMTRKQITESLGLRWRGSAKSLTSSGSYLAELMHRGLVVSLGRCVKGRGSGRSVQLYAVPLAVVPGSFG